MKLPPLDGEPFIEKLEQGIEDGEGDYIEANMPRLREGIRLYQERIAKLSQLQYRARVVQDRHEPSAKLRGFGKD